MSASSLADTGRIIQLIKPKKIAYVSGLCSTSLLESVVPILIPLLIKFVLDAVTLQSTHQLWRACLYFAGATLVLVGLLPIFKYLFGKTVKSIMIQFRLDTYKHLGKLPITYFENTHRGDSISRINHDLGVTEQAISGHIQALVSLMMKGLYAAVVMLVLDWRFAVVLFILGIVSTYVNTRFARPMRIISEDIHSLSSKIAQRLLDTIEGTQVIRIFQMKEAMKESFSKTNHELAERSMARMAKSALLNGTNYTLVWLNNGGVFIFGALMIIYGQTTIGTVLSLILLLDHVTNVFRQLGSFWANLQASLAGASRVFELWDIEPEPEKIVIDHISSTKVEEFHPGIVNFHQVKFGYDAHTHVLHDISFRVEGGQFIAFVGPSGGGKSTVLKLLQGFYPSFGGEIWLDGKPITAYSIKELRDLAAYVSQDGYLFDGTIAENIRLGRPQASFDEVVAAARAANAHEFILKQEQGYDTMVGERGVKLSGGQKQRISIARALLKDSPILLLDEATSALDAESEQAIQESLKEIMKQKTIIAVAHRLSTIQHADTIFVVDKGTIVEQGTHDNLIAAGGMYQRLYAASLSSLT